MDQLSAYFFVLIIYNDNDCISYLNYNLLYLKIYKKLTNQYTTSFLSSHWPGFLVAN
jgi:hypothetical protein